ncbi:MAG TPA: recombinase family protein [Armatimonadota bacterium]
MIPILYCIIYVRVSSERQVREGNGLLSQEQRCRAYAEAKGYQVLAVFRDEGVSGALLERPGIQELLAFLQGRQGMGETIVIIDDISRIARDVSTHIRLRAAIKACGGRLESPSFRFEENAMGEMVETIFAAVAQYGRSGNREQVVNRQRARLEAGFWTFHPPAGYVYAKHPEYKKVLQPDGARAALVREALDSFALKRFLSQQDIVNFFKQHGFYPSLSHPFSGRFQVGAHRVLQNRWFYAGYIEYPRWGIARRLGRHAPIISPDTARRIDLRLADRPAPALFRRDGDQVLVLRNYVRCAGCGRPLTGGLAKHKYPGYFCYNEGDCPKYGHRIKLRELHGALTELLRGLAATDHQVAVLGQVTHTLWDERAAEAGQGEQQARDRLRTLDTQVSALSRRIGLATEATLIEVYERELVRIGDERAAIASAAQVPAVSAADYDQAFARVCTALKSPHTLWETGSADQKKTICRLVFATPPVYDRERGFCTIDLSVPYQVIRHLAAPDSRLVDLSSKTLHLVLESVLAWSERLQAVGL